MAVLIGPYIATALVGMLGLTTTTSVTAASIFSYMFMGGMTYGTLDSASKGEPFLENLKEGLETGAAWSAVALVLYASYLLLLELIEMVGKITPESISDALDGVFETIEEWFGEGGSKTIPYTDYDNIYQSSIHNADADMVMLGKYDGGGPSSYIKQAGDDYTYFSLDNWNDIKKQYGFTDEDMFKLFNEPFLDDGINAGKTFKFSHDPTLDTGSLGAEFEYLIKNNYIWDPDTMTMSPKY